jgi:hypothetical protein
MQVSACAGWRLRTNAVFDETCGNLIQIASHN